jgi:hypothetical protein
LCDIPPVVETHAQIGNIARRGDGNVPPPDERHGDGDGGGDDGGETVEFKPHISLIYAPIHHVHVTDGRLEEYTTKIMDRACNRCRERTVYDADDATDDATNFADDDHRDVSVTLGWDAYVSIWLYGGRER